MRTEARVLFDAGHGCNAIASKLDISASVISRWAKAEGLKFDRAQVAVAVKAHTFDLAAARLALAEKMMTVATDLLDSAQSPYTVFNFGGKDNTYEEHTLDAPPVEAKRSMVVTAGIAFDKATKVLEKDTSGVVTAHSLLDTLILGLESKAADYETPPSAE